jgi:hypothetical protein
VGVGPRKFHWTRLPLIPEVVLGRRVQYPSNFFYPTRYLPEGSHLMDLEKINSMFSNPTVNNKIKKNQRENFKLAEKNSFDWLD